MKFLTQMKACDVVTVSDGVVQAIKGPVAYFGYSSSFEGHAFAVDAKMFVATMKKFKEHPRVVERDDKIVFFDEKQEVDFIPQPAEQLLPLDIKWKHLPGFAKHWNIANSFVDTDFPGLRIVDDGYIEVLSDASIVRVKTDVDNFEGIYASVKLPAGINFIGERNRRLYFSSSPTDIIVTNSLDVLFPITQRYFTEWDTYNFVPIPQVLRSRFVRTDQTVFTDQGVQFVQKEKATASIEGVHGHGTYSGKLFDNVVAYGQQYAFLDNFLAFEAPGIQGVVSRAGY